MPLDRRAARSLRHGGIDISHPGSKTLVHLRVKGQPKKGYSVVSCVLLGDRNEGRVRSRIAFCIWRAFERRKAPARSDSVSVSG